MIHYQIIFLVCTTWAVPLHTWARRTLEKVRLLHFYHCFICVLYHSCFKKGLVRRFEQIVTQIKCSEKNQFPNLRWYVQFGLIPSTNFIKSLHIPSYWKVEKQWFGSLFWGWDQIENSLRDYPAFSILQLHALSCLISEGIFNLVPSS